MSLGDLTVVVPTRNEAQTIPSLLRSLPQSLPLIVVDASQDATPEVVAVLRPHNTVVLRHLGGAGQARQVGALAATTRWLLFSDPGVAFAPGYFGRVGRYLADDVVYGPRLGRGGLSDRYYAWLCRLRRLTPVLGVPPATGANLLVRRSALLDVGGFSSWRGDEDPQFARRMRRRGYQVRFAPDLIVLDCPAQSGEAIAGWPLGPSWRA